MKFKEIAASKPLLSQNKQKQLLLSQNWQKSLL